MSHDFKFIVLPFARTRTRLTALECREVVSAGAAERLAHSLATRLAGALAYEVRVESETGEMLDPRLICAIGDTLESIFEC